MAISEQQWKQAEKEADEHEYQRLQAREREILRTLGELQSQKRTSAIYKKSYELNKVREEMEKYSKDGFGEQMQAMITKYQNEMKKMPTNSVEYQEYVEKIKNLEKNLENFIIAKDNDATENGSVEEYGQNKETEKVEPQKEPVQAEDNHVKDSFETLKLLGIM